MLNELGFHKSAGILDKAKGLLGKAKDVERRVGGQDRRFPSGEFHLGPERRSKKPYDRRNADAFIRVNRK